MKLLQVIIPHRRGICFDSEFLFCSSPLRHPVLQSPFQQLFELIFKQLLETFMPKYQKKPQNQKPTKPQDNCHSRMYSGTTKWESWAHQPLPDAGPKGRRRVVLAGSFME